MHCPEQKDYRPIEAPRANADLLLTYGVGPSLLLWQTACADKFPKIMEAYETLKSQRAALDC
eukprot:5556011-Amphidinium_carterae.1